MSVKTQTYSELAEKTSKELTHSVNDWCMFLKSQASTLLFRKKNITKRIQLKTKAVIERIQCHLK